MKTNSAFLDSYDVWMKYKLKKQIQFMEDNNYYFSYTKYELIDEASKLMNITVSGPKKIKKAGMYNYCWPGCLTVMYNQDRVGIVQIEDLPKNNDYAMWLKIIERFDCHLLDETLSKYRMRKGSISRNSKVKLIKYHYKLFRDGEEKNALLASLLTIRNLVFGLLKKVLYVKNK